MPDLLDVTKSAKEIIIDEINRENSILLAYDEFDFSDPTPYSHPSTTKNTKITISPIAGSRYYGSRDIFYNRMELDDILESPTIETIPGNSTLLSELIPQINQAYGINITSVDYYEQTLPVFDPANPFAVLRVTILAKPTSLLFKGSHSLLLGAKRPPVVDDVNIIRKIYIHSTGYALADYKKTIIALNDDATPDTSFDLLRNCSQITAFTVNKFFLTHGKDLVLNGEFSFTLFDSSTPEPVLVNASSLVIRNDGSVKEYFSTPLFNANNTIKYSENKNIEFKYVVDEANIDRANRVYRYNGSGLLDSTYEASGIAYKPTSITLCDDGKLYTVSPVFTGPVPSNNDIPGKQIRVDRLLANGALDTSFNPIIMTGTGVIDPLPVIQILPLVNDGFWLLLNPLYGVSVTSASSVINGVPIIPGIAPQAFAWNPVLRFTESGQWNRSFNNLLRNNLDKSIFLLAGAVLSVGDKLLVGDANKITFFTYKTNPITGIDHQQPISFNDLGELLILNGIDYLDQYRWVNFKASIKQSNSKMLAFGTLAPRLNTGGYGTAISCVTRYLASGKIDRLIHRDVVANTNPATVVVDVAISETLVI